MFQAIFVKLAHNFLGTWKIAMHRLFKYASSYSTLSFLKFSIFVSLNVFGPCSVFDVRGLLIRNYNFYCCFVELDQWVDKLTIIHCYCRVFIAAKRFCNNCTQKKQSSILKLISRFNSLLQSYQIPDYNPGWESFYSKILNFRFRKLSFNFLVCKSFYSLNLNQSNFHWLNQWFAFSLIHQWKNIFHF